MYITLRNINRINIMRYVRLLKFVLFFLSFSSVYAQRGAYVFNDDVVHELHVDFTDPIYDASNGYRWRDSLFAFHSRANWDYTGNTKEQYQQVSIRFDTMQLDSVGIRGKGEASFFGTTVGKKYALKLDFDRFKSSKGQDLNGLGKLNLQNEYGDNSLLSNKICYDLFHWMGMIAPRASFCKVFINGEYKGVYTLVEQIDSKFLGLNYEKNDGDLYKAFFANFETSEDNYDGSNWIENRFDVKTNKQNHDFSGLLSIYDLVDNATDNSLADDLENVIDMENYIKHFAADMYTLSIDNYFLGAGANIMFYYDSTQMKYTTIPWDHNLSFESKFHVENPDKIKVSVALDPDVNYFLGNPSRIYRRKINRLGVLNDPENRKKLLTHLCHLKSAYFTEEVIIKEFNKHHELIKDAFYEDSLTTLTRAEFDASVSDFRTMVDLLNDFYAAELQREGFVCPDFVPVTDVVLNEMDLFIDIDEEVLLDISTVPSDATYPSFYWEVEDKKIASIKFFGRIKGKKAGNTVVTLKTHDGTVVKTINVTVNDEITALEDEIQSSLFSVYPNPIQGSFKINSASDLVINSVELWSQEGKLLKTYGKVETFSTNEFDAGVYILKVKTTDKEFSKKIVKF